MECKVCRDTGWGPLKGGPANPRNRPCKEEGCQGHARWLQREEELREIADAVDPRTPDA